MYFYFIKIIYIICGKAGVEVKITKESLLEYIQKEIFTDSKHKEGLSTHEIADTFQIQRSNASSLLNALVKEGKLEKR